MKVNELRIGNIVQSVISNFELTIVGVIGDRIFYGDKCTPDVRPDYEVEPIPLTEEWIVKFGFIQVQNYIFALTGEELTINKPVV